MAAALLIAMGGSASAAGPFLPATPQPAMLTEEEWSAALAAAPENHRAVAIGLAALLGPFGAHRLYLGTTPKVAVVYGLTFGGFGVLVLIDLVHLITARDLERFRNNGRVLMWAEAPTPP
ncbi:MAG: TM2 domain-containing protein [Flavobacteriales bacterium]|jgi:TM2 domain-containing membrane protein YozV|nr:MAG: TM2 domain-containing protein [Flavobacteriales bacterium]